MTKLLKKSQYTSASLEAGNSKNDLKIEKITLTKEVIAKLTFKDQQTGEIKKAKNGTKNF